MRDLENLENCKCVHITDCDLSLIKKFYINDDKDAQSLEYYIKSPDGAMFEEYSGQARTYVVIDTTLNCIIGYFTLRAGQCFINQGNMFKKKFHVYPGIELAMFAINDQYRELYTDKTFSFGEWIFYRYITEIAKQVAAIVGVRILYIFALPCKPKLISFYKRLGFTNPVYASGKKRYIRTIIPAFDDGCIFMCQNL